MILKLHEIRDLYNGLNTVLDLESEFDFSYAIAKNRRLLKSYVEHLEEKFKPSKEYSEYENDRLKTAVEMSEKDENDQPKIVNNSYVIKKELRADFKAAMEELKETYKETLKAQKELAEKLEDTLNEEKEVELFLIKKEVLPKLTPKQMEYVLFLLEN